MNRPLSALLEIAMLALFLVAGTSEGGELTVRPFEHRHPFITGGAGYSLYYGHINSLSPENQEKVFDWLFEDLNNEIIRPSFRDSEDVNDNNDPGVLDLSSFTVSGQHDGMADFILRAKQRNPRVVVMPYCSSFPDFLVNKNGEGEITSLKTGASDFYEEYAEWLYGNIVYYHNLGVKIDILDLFNEPDFDKPYLDKDICGDLIKNGMPILRQLIADNFATHPVEMPEVCAPSNLGVESARNYLEDWHDNRANVWDNFEILSCHPYNDGFNWNHYNAISALKDGKHWRFIQNEMEFGHGSFRDNGDDPLPVDALEGEIEGALALGRVFSISVLAGATDFMVFQGNGPQPLELAKGLVYTPWNGTPVRTKGYYVYKMLTTMQPYGSDVVDRTLSGSPTGYHANTFHKWGDHRVFVTMVNATPADETTTLTFLDAANQSIPFQRIEDFVTSESLNLVELDDHHFATPATSWDVTVDANSVRTFIVHLNRVAIAPGKMTYLRERSWSDLNITPQDGDSDPDHEILLGYNGDGVLGTGKGRMRGLLEFGLESVRLAPGQSLSSAAVELTAYRGDVDPSESVGLDLYAYPFDFVEAAATWEDPDGDGSPATGDPVAGGSHGSWMVPGPVTDGDSGDYDADGISETFSLPVTFSGSALDAAVTSALGGKLRMMIDPRDGDTTESDFLGFHDEDSSDPAKLPVLELVFGGSVLPGLLTNGGFDASSYTAGWAVSGTGTQEQIDGLEMTSMNAMRLAYNQPRNISQSFAAQRDVTLGFLVEVAGTSASRSLHFGLDSGGADVLQVRVGSGGVPQVNVAGAWIAVDSGGLDADVTYEFEVIGRDLGLASASWDLSWWPVSDPAVAVVLTDLKVFADPVAATSGSGVNGLSIEQIGLSAHSFVVDEVSLHGAASGQMVETHSLVGLGGSTEGFMSWLANQGISLSPGYAILADQDGDEDGLSALLEYVFGLDLSSADHLAGLRELEVEPAGWLFTVVVRDDDPELVLDFEASATLGNSWVVLDSGEEQAGVDQAGVGEGFRRRSFLLPVGERMFARVRAFHP